MRFNLIAVSFAFLTLIASAYSDVKYTCTNSSVGLTNVLTVDGAGTDAKIHIESSLISGDLTYNDAGTQAISGQTGYDVFMGPCIDKLDTPPSQMQGAFLFQPALLSGGVGSMEQFANDGFLVLDCVKSR
jgi:hypothetical protein